MTNDIQRARDVLAKWRRLATPAPWRISAAEPRWVWGSESGAEVGDLVQGRLDGELIVGTAGNPDLLNAIDLMLDAGSRYWEGNPIRQHAQRIAASIIAADERMSA